MESVSLSKHDDSLTYTRSYLLRAHGKDVIQMCPKFNTLINLTYSTENFTLLNFPIFFLTMCHLVGLFQLLPLGAYGICEMLRFTSVCLFKIFGRTSWTSDQPVARSLSNTHRHSCLEWDSNPRSQRSSERRQFMS
jgi:hypothetical protein